MECKHGHAWDEAEFPCIINHFTMSRKIISFALLTCQAGMNSIMVYGYSVYKIYTFFKWIEEEYLNSNVKKKYLHVSDARSMF